MVHHGQLTLEATSSWEERPRTYVCPVGSGGPPITPLVKM
jgi:hypothetical protein